MMDEENTYWRPQVMRHSAPKVEYAIHEVYFFKNGTVAGYTGDALSNRYESIFALKEALEELKNSGENNIKCGDLGYDYTNFDIELWLKHISDPFIEYVE